jgi:hypothetical protein
MACSSAKKAARAGLVAGFKDDSGGSLGMFNSSSNPRGQAMDDNLRSSLAQLSKIMIHLHPKPRVSRAAERLFKAERHLRGDAAAPGNDIMQLLARDAKALCGIRNTQAKVVQALLNEKTRMYRLLHLHSLSPSMVVDKIHIESISIFKAEDDPPIGADRDREETFQIPLKMMQTKGRQVHALDLFRRVQRGKNDSDPRQHVRWQPAAFIALKQSLQSFVAKALDHGNYCKVLFYIQQLFCCRFAVARRRQKCPLLAHLISRLALFFSQTKSRLIYVK